MIGVQHLWLLAILLIVVLIIWGPGKLPDVGSGLGRAIQEFRKASSSARDEVTKATRPEEAPAAPATVATAAPVQVPAPIVVPTPVQAQPAPVTVPAGSTPENGSITTPQVAPEGDAQLPS